MKSKRVFTYALACYFFIAGCAGGGQTVYIPAPSNNGVVTESSTLAETNRSVETARPDQVTQPAQPTPTIEMVSLPFDELQPFSEERAWVKYTLNGEQKAAIIDTGGNCIFTSDANPMYCSQFVDGISYCLVDGWPNCRFFIVDRGGNKLFTNENGENGYILIGYGGGHFLIAEHVANFDTNEWRIGTMDKNGTILNELRPDKMDVEYIAKYPNKAEYLSRDMGWYSGDNLIITTAYAVKLKGVYNIELGTLSYISGQICGVFNEGYSLLYTFPELKNSRNNIFQINSNYHGDDENLIKLSISVYDSDNEGLYGTPHSDRTSGRTYSLNRKLYSEGLVFAWDSSQSQFGYYDVLGNCVISFPDLSGRSYGGSPFNGGYAALRIIGADGAPYVTLIDKSGTMLFDPIKTDSVNIFDSGGGYVYAKIDGRRVLINKQGDIITGVADISEIGADISFSDISGGFVIIDKHYVSLDAKLTIGDIKLANTAGSANTLNNTQSILASTYTGKFDIVGMWSNSANLIISFLDNSTCSPSLFGFDGGPVGNWNISSMADENGHYILQASHITGGSPSYKIRVINKDEIELYADSGVEFGADYYHLWRR